MTRRDARACLVVTTMSFGMCAATPPVRDGTHLRGGAGFGLYQYNSGGCDGPVELRDAAEVRFAFRAEHFWSRLGVNLVVEVMLATFTDLRRQWLLDDESRPGPELRTDGTWDLDAVFTTIRLGYHREHFGLELGTLLFTYLPYVSANAWFGHREFHGWLGFNDGPLRWRHVPPNPIWPVSFGVGHVDERRRIKLGYQADGMALEAHFRVPGGRRHRPWWLGARLNFAGAASWGTMGYIGVDLGE